MPCGLRSLELNRTAWFAGSKVILKSCRYELRARWTVRAELRSDFQADAGNSTALWSSSRAPRRRRRAAFGREMQRLMAIKVARTVQVLLPANVRRALFGWDRRRS